MVGGARIRLYDTARREVTALTPGPVVTIYVCGITPYDSTHIGHAATYLTYDVLIRRLEDLGHEVRMVRNFTDIDDPLFERARSLGVDAGELARDEMARFRSDMIALDMRPAFAEPTVTGSIPQITDLIADLAEGGHTYTVAGTTWFDVSTVQDFGALAHLPVEKLIQLAAENGGTPDDPRQRNPLDFVLWRPSDPGEPFWESPWGPGRPGWHIECSAMIRATLGDSIDIHGGGQDLVFPHHECEQTQSRAATGVPLAGHWTHVGMVAYEGEKMSKSKGNLVFVSELLKDVEPDAIRLAVLGHHYRAGFEWVDDDLRRAEAQLERLRGMADRPGDPSVLEHVREALDDDLDTPRAIRCLGEYGDGPAHPDGPTAFGHATSLLGLHLS